MLDLDAVGALFESQCTCSAFRMEVMDRYDVVTDGDDVARYLAGEQVPDAAAKGPWLDQLRDDTAAGKRWSRVHVLQQPLSDYLRYECEWGYVYNAAAGEDIRILDLSEQDRPDALIEQEFWILDDACVLRMHYDAGSFVGGEVLPASELSRYRAARDAAWAAAEPFDPWWARHPQYHRASRTT